MSVSPKFIGSPTEQDLREAGFSIKTASKQLKVKSHNVKIFDMSNKQDVSKYCKLIKELISGLKDNKYAIWSNEKEFIKDQSGNSTWKKYLEWTEYEVRDEGL